MRGRSWLMALAISAGLGSFAMADVTGKATFDGKPPAPKEINMKAVPQCAAAHADPVYDETYVIGEKGELKNVVVYVKDGAKLGGEAAATTPVVLDQKGCVYVPHVAVVRVGQELKARNSDNFLHNVHGLAKDNGEFNFPQQSAGQENKIEGTKSAETYKVKCDIHPWMNAWVVVLDHGFSGTTGDNGEFTIKGLKDGKYTLVAWHERLGTQEAEIEVKDGKTAAPVEFKFKPKVKAAAADSIKGLTETLTSTVTKPANEECEHCKEAAAKVATKNATPAATPVAASK